MAIYRVTLASDYYRAGHVCNAMGMYRKDETQGLVRINNTKRITNWYGYMPKSLPVYPLNTGATVEAFGFLISRE